MWLATQTRPDISNAVRAVARYRACPKIVPWRAALGVLGHVKRINSFEVTFFQKGSVAGVRMQVFADADYASKAADRQSVSGGVVMCGGGVFVSKNCVTLSTTKAEHVAMLDVTKEF